MRYDHDIDERAILAVARRHRDADDIAQLARLWVLEAREPRDCSRGERAAYVTSIARNAARRHLRTRTRWGRDGESGGIERVLDREHSIDARLDIDASLRHLSPRIRMWFRLRFIAGMSRTDAARWLGVSTKTIEAQLTKGYHEGLRP